MGTVGRWVPDPGAPSGKMPFYPPVPSLPSFLLFNLCFPSWHFPCFRHLSPCLPSPSPLNILLLSSSTPMPFCLLALPLVSSLGVPSHCLLVQQQPLQLLWLSWLSWLSFLLASPWTPGGGKPQKDPPAERFLTHCSLRGRSSVPLREVWGCFISRGDGETHGTAWGNH